MKKMLASKYRPVQPTPAVLITSIDENGKPNIMTAGEAFNISIGHPVIVGIAIRSATYTHSLIQKAREYVINLTSADLAAAVDRCGSISGRDGVDKFKEFGLTPVPSSFVKPPLIDECPVNIECKVMDIKPIGDHDLILGEVLAVHANDSVLDQKGNLDAEKLNLIVFLNGGYWKTGAKIGNQGFSRK
jgi:flavin reductase (DIM6/NTAB) family NADH-FMN oxidoreductase RutF